VRYAVDLIVSRVKSFANTHKKSPLIDAKGLYIAAWLIGRLWGAFPKKGSLSILAFAK